MHNYLQPDLPLPLHVRAYVSTRSEGFSAGSYESFNLADHVGDRAGAVLRNREKLRAELHLPSKPAWLNQVHGVTVIDAADAKITPEADASFTTKTHTVCAVLTADCLPLLITDSKGSCVAAIHAGWRGLCAGVIEETLKRMPCLSKDLHAWLGPAIGPTAFEVGEEVRQKFLERDIAASKAFIAVSKDKYLADIYLLATQRLNKVGVKNIYGGNFCTFTDSSRFYSFRREGKNTGRMASLIWLEEK